MKQSILKVECDCLPEIEFYVIPVLFWIWPQSQTCPRAMRCWAGIWSYLLELLVRMVRHSQL